MISAVSSFTLVALPLFVLAGTIMNAGGISGRLFEFARALVGWLRGGLAHVDVLTSMFFGGMIGSSTADLAGTGSITIPALKRHGYPAEVGHIDFDWALRLMRPLIDILSYSALSSVWSLGCLSLSFSCCLLVPSEADLVTMQNRERELRQTIDDLKNVSLTPAEHFARLTEPGEGRSRRRDYILFGLGVIVSAAISYILEVAL